MNRVVGVSVVVLDSVTSSSETEAGIVVGKEDEVTVGFEGVFSGLREEVVKNLSETEIILIV